MLLFSLKFYLSPNKIFKKGPSIIKGYIDVMNNNRSMKIANIILMKIFSIEKITLFLNFRIPTIRPNTTMVHQRISNTNSLNFAVISVKNNMMSSNCSKSTPTPHNDGLF